MVALFPTKRWCLDGLIFGIKDFEQPHNNVNVVVLFLTV